MSNLYNDRKRQRDEDAKHAASVSPTAIVLRDNSGNPILLDYGPDAGAGSSDLPLRPIEAGLKHGREGEFLVFLREQTDRYSRWLLTFESRSRREFNEALAQWVREWDAVDLPIHDAVSWQRKT